MNMLYHAHSGVRFLVFLAALAALLVLLAAVLRKRPYGRAERGVTSAFVGLLDLQAVLGIIMVAMGRFYPSLMGHLTMMVLAAVAAHGAAALARKSTDERRAASVALFGVVVALALVAGGILAIRDSVFEARAFADGGAPAAEQAAP